MTRACSSCLAFSDPRPSRPSSPGSMRCSTASCSACPEVGCRGGSDRSSSHISPSAAASGVPKIASSRSASHADMRCLYGTRPGAAPSSISTVSPFRLPTHSAAVIGMGTPSYRSARPLPSLKTCMSVTRSCVDRPSPFRSSTMPRRAPSPARWRARASLRRPGSSVTMGMCVQPRLACAASACQPFAHHGPPSPPPSPSPAAHETHETSTMCLW